jgi:integrase
MEFVDPIKSKKDIKRIKDILIKRSYRDYFMFSFGINIGLRISDLLKLKVKDVKEDVIYMRDKKTNKDNRFPIIPELREEIDKYIEGMDDEDYLFPSKKKLGEPIEPDRAYIIMRDVGKEIGLEHLGSHTLRKTFGYHFYIRTKDVAFLMDLFNHSSQKVTLRYIGIDIDYRREALENGFL